MPPTFTFATDHAPRKVTTARQVHIRRLFDLLELSIQRHDSHSARRAWSILCRCKDVQWKHLWRLGLLMLSEDRGQSTPVEYLRAMMFQHPEQASRGSSLSSHRASFSTTRKNPFSKRLSMSWSRKRTIGTLLPNSSC